MDDFDYEFVPQEYNQKVIAFLEEGLKLKNQILRKEMRNVHRIITN